MQINSKSLKPIQLIKFDQKKNIILTPQAIDLFNNKLQSKQLCIVCVAGKYRTGKSYILNRVLLEQSHGFEVGPTINACTKGLWMWPEIVKLNVCGHLKQCIVIDTEGLGSLQQGQNTDLKIFLMAMLLSSYLIYNSVGSIDQKALQSLNLVINMAQLLQKSGDKFDSQQLINSFPSFLWLVRDFSLRLQDQTGQPIASQQYLQNALKSHKAKSAAAEKKNLIRKQLKTFFSNRDCFTLIRPTLNEKDLQNLSTLQEKKLRPQFVDLIKQLRSRIHLNIQPKKIRGKSVTPQGFIQLCNYYINNINSGKLPSINSHWDNLCMSQSGRLVKKYQTRLKQFVDQKIIKGEQIGQYELKSACEFLLKQAIEIVDKSFLGKLQKKLLKQKLNQSLNNKLNQVFDLQFKSSEDVVQNQVKQLFAQNNIYFETLNDQDQSQQLNSKQQNSFNFYHKIDSLKKTFESFTQIMNKSSNHSNQLSSGTNKKHVEFITRMYGQFFEQINQKLMKLIEEQFFYLNQQNTHLKQKFNCVDKYHQDEIVSQKKDILILKTSLQQNERKMKNEALMRQKFQNKVSQLNQINTKLEKQIQSLHKIIQQKVIQHQKTKLSQQSNIKESLKEKINQLQNQLFICEQKNYCLTQQFRDLQIKQRKNHRQCQIYKQKFMDKQKENQQANKQIEDLKLQITKIQKEKRNLIRKTSTKNLNPNFNSSLSVSTASFKQMLNESRSYNKLNQTVYTLQDEQFPNNSSQIQELLTKINELKISNKKLHDQNKNILKLFNQQRSINALLVQTPQSINYQSLKKNYQLQKQQTQNLLKKVKDYQCTFSYINQVECTICGEFINKNSMFSNHWMKCINNKKKPIQFDVSYVYNAQGQLNFLFELTVQNQWDDPLVRLGFSTQSKQTKWQVTKSLKSIQMLLKILQKSKKDIFLFVQSEELSPKKQTQNLSEQKINLNQKRRLYLDDLCHSLKQQIWKRNQFIQFFAIDLHLLRKTKNEKKQKLFTKRKKLGILNLDLGQIIEEQNENDSSYNKKSSNNKMLAESLNMMKTSKFSMKKVFKFGPNV